MPIKPYAIIEIFKSKGFDSREAEEIVDFITESSQEKVLEAIKPLATSKEVKEIEVRLELQIKDMELRLIKWLTTTGIAIVAILIAAMKFIK